MRFSSLVETPNDTPRHPKNTQTEEVSDSWGTQKKQSQAEREKRKEHAQLILSHATQMAEEESGFFAPPPTQ